MKRRQFTLWHSLLGTAALILIEWFLLYLFAPQGLRLWVIFISAAVGAIGNIYVSTEIIEEVKSAWHMLILLSFAVAEFVVFFAFEYWLLLMVEPTSFSTLPDAPASLLLHSIMIFVFNPIYLPTSSDGQVLLLINTLGALGVVLFLLQNIGQFRRNAA
jgi:hypothetical protein